MATQLLFARKAITTADSIANQIREDILRGNLQPNQVLRQDKIASEHGVSTIPVREALFQLNGEGLIEFIPHRGAFVSALTRDSLQEICIIRQNLELLALGSAISLVNDSELQQAETIMVQMDTQTDMMKWAELNWQFHKCLWEASNMPYLVQILRNLHINVNRYLAKSVPSLNDKAYHAQHRLEHLRILEACHQRDKEVALIQLQRHLENVRIMIHNLG